MQKIIFWGFLLLTLIMVPAKAQNDGKYRLHEPSIEEYINKVETVLQIANTDYKAPNRDTLLAEATAMADEVNWRYLDHDQINSHQLKRLYQLYIQLLGDQDYYGDPPGTEWLYPLVGLWLEENPTDLAEVNQISFEDYIIEVDTLTNENSTWAYLLRVLGQPYYGSRPFLGSFIAIPDDTSGYVLIEPPYPITGSILASGDIDDDGMLEIAYSRTIELSINARFVGELVVARLEQYAFETVTTLSYSHGPIGDYVRFWFVNMDAEDDLELVWNQRLSAVGWECDFIETTVYDWNTEGQLVEESAADVYPDTFGCLFLQAEQAMWSYDYKDAVSLYQQAFAQESINDHYLPYAQIRMALAYLLNGQTDEANTTFSQIDQSNSDLAQTMAAAYERSPRALSVCQAFYQYAFDGEDHLPVHGTMDRYTGAFSRLTAGMIYSNPENATCDFSHHLDIALSTMTFPIDESPLTRLETLGLAVADHIEMDLNRDGASEWLIWLDSPGIEPLFFSPANEHYQLTRFQSPDQPYQPLALRLLRPPDEVNHYQIIMLPNGRQALVNFDFGKDIYEIVNCDSYCASANSSTYCADSASTFVPCQAGDLTLWQLENHVLTNTLLAALDEPQTIVDLFPPGEIIDAFQAAVKSPYEALVQPAAYTWNENTGTFVIVEEPEPTATQTPFPVTVTPPPTTEPEPVYTLDSVHAFRAAFVDRDYTLVVHIADDALANATDADAEQWKYAFRYSRALALEALDRPDDALAEYLIIYEVAPDSAWGILASLHLQAIEGK